MKKRIFAILLIITLFIGVLIYSGSYAFASTSSYCVMNVETGEIILKSNENEKKSIASLTKIITAITALESDFDLDEKYYVPKSIVGVEGSSIYLRENEIITLRELLYGLMLRSGNDSAECIATLVSGGNNNFACEMNKLAVDVGATSSHFVNPHGLDNEKHYSTAKDLCKITSFALDNPEFAKIVSSKSYKGLRQTYVNKNKMLFLYEGANGVKTGYTKRAGRCLVTSATRGNTSLVCCVLNCPDMWKVSKYLLEKGFENSTVK